MNDPFFTVTNRHVETCGVPPVFQLTRDERRYLGYFTGESGDQWLFVGDPQDGRAVVYGGDAGWSQAFTVEDGIAVGLITDRAEALWIHACWIAFAARE